MRPPSPGRRGGRERTKARATVPFSWLDNRPIIVAIAGPNGAGKTTFYVTHVQPAGMRFVNADVMARELTLEPYAAARVAADMRAALVAARESFVFETVFSDPIGEKLGFLAEAAVGGYTVVLCFIGISGADVSETRVAMRVSQGGHDVPGAKLVSRFPRVMENLRRAIAALPHVIVFDNDDLMHPFRMVAEFERGTIARIHGPMPAWLPVADRAAGE